MIWQPATYSYSILWPDNKTVTLLNKHIYAIVLAKLINTGI